MDDSRNIFYNGDRGAAHNYMDPAYSGDFNNRFRIYLNKLARMVACAPLVDLRRCSAQDCSGEIYFRVRKDYYSKFFGNDDPSVVTEQFMNSGIFRQCHVKDAPDPFYMEFYFVI